MKTAAWYIIHQGRKLLAATKREAASLARMIADETGAPVTVRPIPRGSPKTSSHRTLRSNPARRPGDAVSDYVAAVRHNVENAGYRFSTAARNHAVFMATMGARRPSVVGASNLIITYLREGYYKGSPYAGAAANARFRPNPAARPPAELYVVTERDAHGVGIARGPVSRDDAERFARQLAAGHPDQTYSVEAAKYEGRGHARRLKYPDWRPNPAARPARRRQRVGGPSDKLAYLAGVVAARDGKPRTSNPHYGKESTAWRSGFDYAASLYRKNPDPGAYLDVWEHQGRIKRDRAAFMAATKGRRLAKSLRGRDRGGAAKAHERGAMKTARFAVRATNRRESFNLGRPSRRAAEALADEFRAAGYTVEIMEL